MTSSIAKFYSGRSVFITGGLGFIGKQTIEKLLRSCPEVETIYLLVREKKGQTVEQRLKQTLTSPVFDRLRPLQPNFHRKIVPIVGDVTHDFLGIKDSDHSRIASKVSVVIHSAATLNFQEPLRIAVDMNILGVQRMLQVCKELPKLDALVHISTGYAHVDKGKHNEAVIEEKIYDPPMTPEQIITMTREMTDQQLAELTPKLLQTHRRPNTYTLTKAIAEKLIEQEHGKIPCCIIRPTIVAASYAEPFPGWLDNFTAANGIFCGFGMGFIRAVYTSPQSPLDIIPVDMVANALAVAAWNTATCRNELNAVPVYHLTNEGVTTVAETAVGMTSTIHADPYGPLPVRKPLTGLPYSTTSWLLFTYWKDVYLPARFKLMDTALQITGKKPRLSKMYEKTNKLQDVLVYFTRNGFKWSNDNTKKLFAKMNDADKKEFNFQIGQMDLTSYYRSWWQGIKQFMFKEKKTTAPQPVASTATETKGFSA